MPQDKPKHQHGLQVNRIPLPFEKAVKGLLAVKPTKRAAKPKKKPGKR